jgi:hypothetical protein
VVFPKGSYEYRAMIVPELFNISLVEPKWSDV